MSNPDQLEAPTTRAMRDELAVLEKLGLRDRVDLTRYAIRRGLVEP
jgi:hypothetical protein